MYLKSNFCYYNIKNVWDFMELVSTFSSNFSLVLVISKYIVCWSGYMTYYIQFIYFYLFYLFIFILPYIESYLFYLTFFRYIYSRFLHDNYLKYLLPNEEYRKYRIT